MIEAYKILSNTECDHIIELFNRDDSRLPGRVAGDKVSPEHKKSIDLHLSFDKDCHQEYNNIILPAITAALDVYVNTYPHLKDGPKFTVFDMYNIQYYGDGDGYFTLHHEVQPSKDNIYIHRMIAWMIYLNDAESGTEFPYQDTILKPETGCIAMWPAYWTHPHKGVTPNVGDKYIATGWLNYLPVT
tara:strand:+ start:22 stop:582 length:561 start_codon:yes stop_codon:yes gene_type:complete